VGLLPLDERGVVAMNELRQKSKQITMTCHRFATHHLWMSFAALSSVIMVCSHPSDASKSQIHQSPKHADAPPTHLARLRIKNGGSTVIKKLSVLFPHDEVVFGDIPVGMTTAYKTVPHGVYSYAAYRLFINGKRTLVPVTDWVGEKPLTGSAFTYVLRRGKRQNVDTLRVIRDK
jgi:hypothetical protein